jgi:hypothetical protein
MFTFTILGGCACSQQEAQEVQNQGEGQQQDGQMSQNSQNENEMNNDNFGEIDANPEGEAVNNAVVNEFAETEPSETLDSPTNPMNYSNTTVANGAADAAPINSAVAATDSLAPTSGGSVMYAPAIIYGYGTPQGTSDPTCVLEKGDHPLVAKGPEWIQMKPNQFVKSTDLSDLATARDRSPADWAH